MAQMDSFYNRLMPKLPLPKTPEEQKARDESNQRVKEKLRQNPNATTYLGMTGVGNNREFTNPVAPIARAYNNAGGGASGIGGVLGAIGKTGANQAKEVKETYDAFAQPFLATMQGMVNNAISRYNLAKSALPAAKNAVSDVAKGVSSGYTGTPINKRTDMETAWSSVDGKNTQRLTPAQSVGTVPIPASSPTAPVSASEDLNQIPSSRMEKRRAAEQSAVLGNMNLTPKDDAMIRAAQMESDYNKGVMNNPNSMGVNVEAGGRRTLAPIFVDPSRQIGMAQYSSGTPFEPSQGIPAMPANNPSQPMYRSLMTGQGATGPVSAGGSDVPLYETVYRDKDGNPIATITGQNQRAGGGTLSFIGKRTPEEQAAVNETVKQIESQTATMRGLRNANRQEQGLMTVEQERQANDMQKLMGQLAPRPDMGRLDEQQAALMQQLKDVQNIKGWGKGRQRDDAIKAAQFGLAQLANQRGELGQQYGQQAGLAQNMMQNQAAQEAAQSKAMQDFARFQADYGLRQEANQLAGQKNELDAAQAGQRAAWEQRQFGGNAAMKQQEALRSLFPGVAEQKLYYTEDINNPGKPILNKSATGLSDLPSGPSGKPQPGGIYLNGDQPVFIDNDGNPQPIPGGINMAVYLNRVRQMQGIGAIGLP